MTDIVERLRAAGDREEGRPYSTMHEAADEIERLRELLRGTGANRYWEARWRDADAEIERLTEALQRIVQWADAYPLDIFHEPSAEECQRASKLLTANGMTLDAFSASMGRHCLMGVGDIARDALK
jgi:hypothetical protein